MPVYMHMVPDLEGTKNGKQWEEKLFPFPSDHPHNSLP